MNSTIWEWIKADRSRTPYEASKHFNLPVEDIWEIINESRKEDDNNKAASEGNS